MTTSTQVLIPDPVVDVVGAEAGEDAVAALTSTGKVFVWRDFQYGQQGNGTTSPAMSQIPMEVPLFASGGVTMLRFREWNSCAVYNGTVHCWGRDAEFSGSQGLGPAAVGTTVTTPTPVDTSLVGAGAIDNPDDMCLLLSSVLIVKGGAL